MSKPTLCSEEEKLEAKTKLCECLFKVSREIDNPNRVLSRWNLEVLFDKVARAVSSYLDSEIEQPDIHVGCSLIYGLLPQRYYVGGASRDRRKMEFDARYYQLDEHWLSSLTAFSMATHVEVLLDDFYTCCNELTVAGSDISHRSTPVL
jgi:hypothetical protein